MNRLSLKNNLAMAAGHRHHSHGSPCIEIKKLPLLCRPTMPLERFAKPMTKSASSNWWI
jgi:hypothetical protein